MQNDLFYINRCQELAEMAAEKQESPVGSVVVLGDKIIGEGIELSKTKQDITCHSEIEAIREAIKKVGKNLSNTTLYTTHEPCIMCSYVIRSHRISRVVIQKTVPHIGGVSSDYPILTVDTIAIWSKPPIIDFI
jgi:tRNA(adenine34) deaminase